ncbi:MAG: phage portal protein, partial [Anaerovoracaceae bacterium]
AELRRFTSATIAAAESAANQAGILKTKVDTTDDDATYAGGEELEIPKNSWLTMPEDSDLQQMRAEHPATTYEMFKNQIINEIARCLNMPFNVAAGNSSNYNYASGRLDWQTYFRAILVIRRWLEGAALGRIFLAWYHEALMVPGYLKYATKDPVNITWHWPGSKHVDPIKEANAQKIRLGSLTTTLANEFAEQGMDWERELKQIAKEKALMKKLGLTMADIAKNQETKEEDDEDDDKKTKGRK